MTCVAVISVGVVVGDEVLEDDLRERQVDLLPVEVRERRDPDERALELADVRRDLRGDVLQDVVGRLEALAAGLLAQDRDAGLEVRRLDVGDEAPLEPRPHPVLEAVELLGRQVGRDHDLLVRVVQRVEGVEELLHRLFLALQELDVVDEEHVDLAVAALERAGLALADRVDEVVGELLGVHVPHADARVEVLRVVADRVQQVRLAQPRVAVDEQRVVGLGRRLGDGDGRGVREPVGRADDERLEQVLRVQARRLGRLLAAGCRSRATGRTLVRCGRAAWRCVVVVGTSDRSARDSRRVVGVRSSSARPGRCSSSAARVPRLAARAVRPRPARGRR